MAQTTYEVKLSVDGNHSVTVKTDNQAETKLAIAWARATFNQLGELHSGGESPDQRDGAEVEETPTCAIHQAPMVKVQGKRGAFWSCHQKNSDGSWCSYRPGDR